MKAVNLDYLADTRPNWAGMTVLAIGLAGLIAVMWYARDLSRDISNQEMLVSKLQAQEKNKTELPVTERRGAEQIASEAKQANAVILALSLPWKELFEAFEASRMNEVAVLAVEPDAQKGMVRITAEAKKLESMLDYSSSLQKIALFREVLIVSHQIQDQDPEQPIRFTLQAAWEIQR